MFKVLIKLRSLSIRLKEGIVDLIIRRKRDQINVEAKSPIVNGESTINGQVEFFIDCADPQFSIQVYITLGNEKKFAGQASVNLKDWEENVYHANTSNLFNSPDKFAKIRFEFYYLKVEHLKQIKSLIQCNELIKNEVSEVKYKNGALSDENQGLKVQANLLKSENLHLQENKSAIHKTFDQMSKGHTQKMNQEQRDINFYSEQHSFHIQKRNELIRAVEQHGQKHISARLTKFMEEEP